MICLGSGGRLCRQTEAGSSLMWTNNVALVFELECKVFSVGHIPKTGTAMAASPACVGLFQQFMVPGLERSWNAILQFASYRIEEKGRFSDVKEAYGGALFAKEGFGYFARDLDATPWALSKFLQSSTICLVSAN
ncbi:hypothetical protein V6N11_044726 [Hibiscus sabdariffa]|uniref:Uncharacterized protein n=1 Tax=Hibiscus sabdariffa TaxID=183260 RepID=A0ABR2PTQ2_9ROSI